MLRPKEMQILEMMTHADNWNFNHSKASRQTGIPVATVWDIVKRLQPKIKLKVRSGKADEQVRDYLKWLKGDSK